MHEEQIYRTAIILARNWTENSLPVSIKSAHSLSYLKSLLSSISTSGFEMKNGKNEETPS